MIGCLPLSLETEILLALHLGDMNKHSANIELNVMLEALQIFSHLILTTNLWGK